MKKILFVASECVPFIKTGGLADVAGALPKFLDSKQYDVRVVLPYYTCIRTDLREKCVCIDHFYMPLGGLGEQYVGIMSCKLEGITYYLIDNERYFGGATPYGNLVWDIEKFCFFSKAALSILPSIGFQPNVIHCHDWQTALLPVFLHEMFLDNPFYWNIRTIITIHNLKFQGIWDIRTLRHFTGLPEHVFTPDRMEFHKDANMLKGGLVYADRITTVSHQYASEIQMPFYGEGLDGLLRAKSDTLSGILNGIDYAIYNPATDPQLYQTYGAYTAKKGKDENKRLLQKELGLPIDTKVMMIGMITRLTSQKGLDLVAWAVEQLLQSHIQFVVIGTGDPQYEDLLRRLEWNHKDQVSSNIYFNEERAHRLYAAADAMLMPSLFEPCGLTQLISLRYGTIPIVRETGGLQDTVQPYNEYEQTGTGFSFCNYNAQEMMNAVFYAEKIFYDAPKNWSQLVQRAMAQDFSWNSSAKTYQALYDQLI